MSLWTLQQLWLGGRRSPRLAGVSLAIEPGVTAVIGPSGAGKTSLLNLLVGFERPDRRSRDGLRCHVDASGFALPVYWVPHDGGLWPHLTARAHLDRVQGAGPERAGRTTHLLTVFDLLDRAGAMPDTMSQGERQRLAVARCLAANPAVMVMDEPLAHVDPGRRGQYWQVIRDHIDTTDCSLIFASHDPATVLAQAQRVVCIHQGKVTYDGAVTTLYHSPPTRELADALGPHNWFEPDEAAQWLDAAMPRDEATPHGNGATGASHSSVTVAAQRVASPSARSREAVCLRPERLELLPAGPASAFVVRDARRCGAFDVTQLSDERTQTSRQVTHRPSGRAWRRGDRVMLRIVTMLLVAVTAALGGCGGGGDPTLAVKEVVYHAMPPAGPRIPSPRSITFGPGDELLVLDTAGRVLVFHPSGQLTRQWEMPRHDQGRPEGACYLADGRIAVADTHYYRVVFFEPDGNVVGAFGSQGDAAGQFRFPVSIVQDDQGHLYVAEYGGNDRVQKFTVDGEHLLTIAGPGLEPGRLSRPQSIAWCRPAAGAGDAVERYDAGILFISDVEKGCVHIFSGAGDYLGLFGRDWIAKLPSRTGGNAAIDVSSGVDPSADDAHDFGMPYGIAVGPDQCVYVLEYQNARVSKFTLDGQLLGRFGSPGRGEEQLLTPWALNVDTHNRIKIADTANARIVELVQ